MPARRVLLVAALLAAIAPTPSAEEPATGTIPTLWGTGDGAGETPIAALGERARQIIQKIQDLEITLAEARTQVERLLRDLVALGKAEGWTTTRQQLTISVARPENTEELSFEECPLFFEEELTRLCPLDQARSEIWGNRVLVCVFACAPSFPEPETEPAR